MCSVLHLTAAYHGTNEHAVSSKPGTLKVRTESKNGVRAEYLISRRDMPCLAVKSSNLRGRAKATMTVATVTLAVSTLMVAARKTDNNLYLTEIYAVARSQQLKAVTLSPIYTSEACEYYLMF